ncbi:DUF1648 domain-containing protein [Neobacillus sp. LXY-1]|uniref:DUF1648 domain-containing protein n=1 Tax=Neobacillus sp. LXY-1 TaxID=3379133 RepID=UPI003EE41EDB
MNSTIFLFIMLVPVFIPFIFIPYWTRKTESFGISIPEDAFYSTDIRNMRKKYAWINGILALLFTVIFYFVSSGHSEHFISIIFPILIFGYIAASFGVYLFFHKKMQDVKNNHKDWIGKSQLIVVDTKFRNQKLTHSNLWMFIPFSLSIFTLAIVLYHYQDIPERFPMQYDFNGEVTRWADKSYRSVLLIPIIQIYMTMLFLFINTIISKAKQQVSAENPEESLRQNIIFRKRWSLFTIIMGTGLVLMLTLQPLSFIYPISHQVLLIAPLVFVIGVCAASIILSITTGQGGSRIGKAAGGKLIDRDDDRFWKLGMFYFNKNDPAIFLEKRFGIGWTNNWAHPISWVITIGIILIIVGLQWFLG